MNKAKKIITAVALSTTLAMGAVPAFAAEEATPAGEPAINETGSFADTGSGNGSASTTLNVYATASQIQATIPVNITVVTPKEGGIITAPSATAYKIVNNNATADLKVTEIKGVDTADWKAVKEFTSPKTGMAAKKGEMQLTVKAGASAAQVVNGTEATKLADDAVAYFTAPAGKELGLTIAGKTSVKADLTANSSYPAVQIAYTVSASATTPAA